MLDAFPRALTRWRKRYDGNPKLWKRLYDETRIVKELIEAVPVMDAVRRLVSDDATTTTTTKGGGDKFTIVDLACGKGYLSMTLSECLPPDRVEKFVLVDRGWAMHGMTPGPHHISWAHIYGSRPTSSDPYPPSDDDDNDGDGDDRCIVRDVAGDRRASGGNDDASDDVSRCNSYYDTWPIPLNTAKVDLKKTKEIREMERRLFSYSDVVGECCGGPIILVAVHLCGTLSMKAVELFNNNPRVRFLCLKPCCLPGENRGCVPIHIVRVFPFPSFACDANLAFLFETRT